jgi:carbonic anhydrase
MFKSFIAACLIAATANAAGGNVAYDYKTLGSDWGSLTDDEGNKPYHLCDDG